jgi:hypothetical protein
MLYSKVDHASLRSTNISVVNTASYSYNSLHGGDTTEAILFHNYYFYYHEDEKNNCLTNPHKVKLFINMRQAPTKNRTSINQIIPILPHITVTKRSDTFRRKQILITK